MTALGSLACRRERGREAGKLKVFLAAQQSPHYDGSAQCPHYYRLNLDNTELQIKCTRSSPSTFICINLFDHSLENNTFFAATV